MSKELDLFQNLIKTIKHDWGIDYRNTFTYVKIEEALKRNEPTKVYIDYDMMAFECSNCVENGTTDSMWSFNEIGEYTYCPRCGNKLDWSEEDE